MGEALAVGVCKEGVEGPERPSLKHRPGGCVRAGVET